MLVSPFLVEYESVSVLLTRFTKTVENGFSCIPGKTMMLEQMALNLPELFAVEMNQPSALLSLAVKMGKAGRGRIRICIACAFSAFNEELLDPAVLDKAFEVTVNRGGSDGGSCLGEVFLQLSSRMVHTGCRLKISQQFLLGPCPIACLRSQSMHPPSTNENGSQF